MKYYTRIGEFERDYVFAHDGDALIARSGEQTWRCERARIGDGGVFSLMVDGRSYDCTVDFENGKAIVQVKGERVVVEVEDDRERAAKLVSKHKGGGKRQVAAAMPGVVVAVSVAVGDVVEERQTLVVIDAMKMQNPIAADGPGVVTAVHVTKGATVSAGSPLVDLAEPEQE